MRSAGFFRAAFLALTATVAMALAGPAVASATDLSPQEARKLAEEAVLAGDPALARALALALLQRDPHDSDAARILSAAEDLLGNDRAARAAARQAWKTAEGAGERYAAARQRALAEYHAENYGTAQWWLRRAAQAAPDDRARALARENFRSVERQNPWALGLRFSLAPSSNINNGSSAETMDFFGVPFLLSGDARALSGTEASLSLSARYRLSPAGARNRTELRFGAVSKTYRLSSQARAQAPNARGSDYAFSAVELGIGHRRRLDDRTSLSLGATAGHNWYGGRDLSDYLRLDGDLSYALDRRNWLELGLGIEEQMRLDARFLSSRTAELRAGYGHVTGSGDRLHFGLALRDTASDGVAIDHRAAALDFDWSRAAPLAGIRLTGGLSAELRDYAQSRFGGTRLDRRLGAHLGMVFERVDYYGFSPSLDLNASRTQSNFSLYDTRDLGVSLGFASNF